MSRSRKGLHQRCLIDIAANKLPLILMLADQRIHQVCAGADVQPGQARAGGDVAVVAFTQQIGKRVDKIGPAGYRRAKITFGDVPIGDRVLQLQERAVELLD